MTGKIAINSEKIEHIRNVPSVTFFLQLLIYKITVLQKLCQTNVNEIPMKCLRRIFVMIFYSVSPLK